MTEIRTMTAAERAGMKALVQAHFGDRYDEVCRGVAERGRTARAHRLAAESGDWSWKTS